jgi:hypothetical protein
MDNSAVSWLRGLRLRKKQFVELVCRELLTLGASERQPVPVKIDAPVSNRSPKPLFQRLLLALWRGPPYAEMRNTYLQLLEHISNSVGWNCWSLMRWNILPSRTAPRLLELTNLTGVPIVCAPAIPLAGPLEMLRSGRWNDYFELTQFTGARLDAFLTCWICCCPLNRMVIWACAKCGWTQPKTGGRSCPFH